MAKFFIKLIIFLNLAFRISSITITETMYTPKLTLEEILYPAIEPFNQDYLKVSDLHKIWFAQYGNPVGIPVIILHGGPGGGSGVYDMRHFDPKIYRIILLDQRGAKNSEPFGELNENNSQNLIEDIEKLKKHLNIGKWLVVGHSWGTALAIAYGETYPNSCLGFILRGIFLVTDDEATQLWFGMQDTFPEVWQKLYEFLPENERDDLINSYYNRLLNPDPKIHMTTARSFMEYDIIASFLLYDKLRVDKLLSSEKVVLGVARIFTHYTINHFFFSNNQLLNNLEKIKHLPAIIVHGRYDTVCRVKMAYKLHRNWLNSNLVIAQDAGHSAMEPGIAKALIEASNAMPGKICKIY